MTQNNSPTRRRLITAVAAAGVVVLALWLVLRAPTQNAVGSRAMGTPPALLTEVQSVNLPIKVESIGTVEANERVMLSAKVTEKVEAVLFRDGDFVAREDLLFQLSDREQRAELAEAKAFLETRRRQLERVRSVEETGAVSQTIIDEEKSRFDSAQAAVDLWEARVLDRQIRAPFDGQVGIRQVSPGALVTPGTALVLIADTDPVKVDFSVPERFLASFRPGLEFSATTVAFPGRTFSGAVETVSPVVDPISRAFLVRGLIPNPEGDLRPGLLMMLEVSLGDRDALVAPESVLLPLGENQFVLRLDEDDRAQRIPVRIGQRIPGKVELVEGVELGDRLVKHGARVQPGQQVRIVSKEEVFEGEQ